MSLTPSDMATDAFERLRNEVVLTRRVVEGLAGRDDVEVVDYAPTLAKLGKGLAEIKAGLAELETGGAFVMTPDVLAGTMHESGKRVLATPLAEIRADRAAMTNAAAAFETASRRLAAAETGFGKHLLRVAACALSAGIIAGALLWGLLLGPVARALPERWHVPERLAAATMGQPVQAAGMRLLDVSDPASIPALRLAQNLTRDEATQLTACLRRAAQASSRQACRIKMQRRQLASDRN